MREQSRCNTVPFLSPRCAVGHALTVGDGTSEGACTPCAGGQYAPTRSSWGGSSQVHAYRTQFDAEAEICVGAACQQAECCKMRCGPGFGVVPGPAPRGARCEACTVNTFR